MGCLKGQDQIGLTVSRIVNRHKMATYFTITDASLVFARKAETIAAWAASDGISGFKLEVQPFLCQIPGGICHFRLQLRPILFTVLAL